jgi:hypothetical protein
MNNEMEDIVRNEHNVIMNKITKVGIDAQISSKYGKERANSEISRRV